MTGVNTQHPEHAVAEEIWELTRAASSGQRAVKAGGRKFLPGFVPEDEQRYEQYKKRAYFMGVTGRTKNSLIGMIFRKSPTYQLPSQIEELLEDIDGAGQSLEQVSKEAVSNVMETGRHVFLVDYPQSGENLDAETERRMGLRPTVASYPAESLINWRFEGLEGKQMLTMAVLAEFVEVDEYDEFSHERERRFRVLRLRRNDDGSRYYTQQVYDDNLQPMGEEYMPLMAGRQPFDHIPMHIAGAENNKPDVDMPPLYDLATVNIAHYQTTADHRENLFIHGQLTLGITSDMSWEEFQAANPGGVQVGARTGHYLGPNGGFTTATAPESGSLRVALQDLENQMVMIGARLVQRGGQAETAEAARINASAEASTLDMVTNNMSEALQATLQDVALFVGAPVDGIQYNLNTEFWEAGLDAQSLQAVMQGVQLGVYAQTDALDMIRKGQIQLNDERSNDDIQADVAGAIVDEAGGGFAGE